jgi:hypothetical protein
MLKDPDLDQVVLEPRSGITGAKAYSYHIMYRVTGITLLKCSHESHALNPIIIIITTYLGISIFGQAQEDRQSRLHCQCPVTDQVFFFHG